MKLFTLIAIVAVALLSLTTPATACDGVAALGTSCYSQAIRARIVERVAVPQYQIVERIEVPQYVERQRVVVEKQYVPAERIIERQKVIVQRQRAYPVRSSLRASAKVVERVAVPRQRVIRRERVVERSVY